MHYGGDGDNHLCTYCFRKIKQIQMPRTCFSNYLDFGRVPREIAELNEFGKIFIQRAKAFQVISRMDTVMGGHNKKHPNESIKKVKGRVFSLPLPIEHTLVSLSLCRK